MKAHWLVLGSLEALEKYGIGRNASIERGRRIERSCSFESWSKPSDCSRKVEKARSNEGSCKRGHGRHSALSLS